MKKIYIKKLPENSLKEAIKKGGKLRSSPETLGMTGSSG
jgi:hypothetical protein